MRESIRTNIRRAIIYGLSQITKRNGYNCTMNNIYDKEHSPEQGDIPFVNVSFGVESYDVNGHTTGYLTKSLPVKFEIYVEDVNNIKEKEAKILADIEEYFMNNDNLPNESNVSQLVGDLMFSGNEMIGIDVDKPFGKIVVNVDLIYLQNVIDPELSTHNSTDIGMLSGIAGVVKISKREDIRKALIYNLKKIKKSGDYKFNINNENVHELWKSSEQINSYPSICIDNGTEVIKNADDYNLQDRRFHKELDYNLYCYVEDLNDILLAQERLVADIEKVIMNNYTLPDENRNRTLISAYFVNNEIYGMEVNDPIGMIRVKLRCLYKPYVFDPAQIVAS